MADDLTLAAPGAGVDLENMPPRQIVAELDKYVVGQSQAKRSVAIALRNRWRRQQLPAEIAEEIAPKNILMIGPTGVGKTEIARRLAKLARSPFLKVEASKFTEVGYVGRDVESMIRDLVDIAFGMVREERREAVREKARDNAEERLLHLLVPSRPLTGYGATGEENEEEESIAKTRQKFRDKLRSPASPASRCSPRRGSRRSASTSRTCCRASSAAAAASRRSPSRRRARSSPSRRPRS